MSKHHIHRNEDNSETKDPVCKMKISQKTAIDTYEFENETYYFCSPNCRMEFELNPKKYLPPKKFFRS
jgi:YHS domain-containing protein